MLVGNEVIETQRDLELVIRLTREVNNIFNIYNLRMDNVTMMDLDRNRHMKVYDKYKRIVKDSMYKKNLDNISDILSKRFGVGIIVENTRRELDDLSRVIMPSLNYKLLNVAMNSMSDLFPKSKDILNKVIKNSREEKLYKILNDIKNALDNDGITIDLENARINGLEGSKFVININFLSAKMAGLEPDEVAALLLKQVGVIFTRLEYMTSTTNATKTLADVFLKERFSGSKEPIDAIKIAIDKTTIDVKTDFSTPVKTLETLDSFILKTYRVSKTNTTIVLDYERLSDQFATRFGIGDLLASMIVKVGDRDIGVSKDGRVYDANNKGTFLTVFSLLAAVVVTVLFSVLGLMIFLTYITVRLISYFFAMLSKFISDVFSRLVLNDPGTMVKKDNIQRRLKQIKLELIRELRKTDAGEIGKDNIMRQLDLVKDLVKQTEEKISVVDSMLEPSRDLDYNKIDDINFLTENLQENELYIMQEKFKLKELS